MLLSFITTVRLGLGVRVAERVIVAVRVRVAERVIVAVRVRVAVLVSVAVRLGVSVVVAVALGVALGMAVALGVILGVGSGSATPLSKNQIVAGSELSVPSLAWMMIRSCSWVVPFCR
jgi:hypothetical protein